MIAAYLRVSTDKQEVEMQEQALQRWVNASFPTFAPGEQVQVFTDTDTGGNRQRQALNNLLEIIQYGTVTKIVVWKLDRLARSLPHLIDLLDKFRFHGVQLVSITEGIDTSTPQGELMFHIIGALAQFERSLIRERVKSGMAAAKERLKKGPYRRERNGKSILVTGVGRPKLANPTNPSTLRSRKRRAKSC